MTVHQAYSNFIKAGMFAEPLDLSVKEILVDNEEIRLSEFLDISTQISKHCLKGDFSWFKNTVKQFPMRALSVLNPSALHFIGSVESLLIGQVEFANSCGSNKENIQG